MRMARLPAPCRAIARIARGEWLTADPPPPKETKKRARVVGGDFAAGMEMLMGLILILTALVLVVGACLIGFAVKAAKKDSVWKQVDEDARRRQTGRRSGKRGWAARPP